jgi:hypothetical protein
MTGGHETEDDRRQKTEDRRQKQKKTPVQPVFFWILTIASGPFWLLSSDNRQ